MALCKDPRLTYLNSHGYNVVLLPREGIEPLDVLGRENGVVNRLGAINQIWTSSAPAPGSNPPHRAADIAGTKTDDIKLSLGLGLLCNILNGMGAVVDLPKLSFAYQRSRKLQFTLGDVVSVAIDPFEIGNYLASGDLRAGNPFVERYFDDEGTSAFVISEVLKSDSVTVSSKDDRGNSVSLDLPAIQQIIGAKVSVTTAGAESSNLSYKGTALLTFGFKAFGVVFADSKWAIHGVKASGDLSFAVGLGEGPRAEPILFGTERLIRLHETNYSMAA